MEYPDEYEPAIESDDSRAEATLMFTELEHLCAFQDWWGMHGLEKFIEWVTNDRHPESR